MFELANLVDWNAVKVTVYTSIDQRNLLLNGHRGVLLLPLMVLESDSTSAGIYRTYLRSSVRRSPRFKVDLVDASKSEPNWAKAATSRYWAKNNFRELTS